MTEDVSILENMYLYDELTCRRDDALVNVLARLKRAESQVAAVRKLHEPYEYTNRKGTWKHCYACEENSDSEYPTDWPCETIQTLDKK